MSTQAPAEDYKSIFIRGFGGEVPSTLSAKVGPLGVPAKVVGEDIKKVTSDFKGIRVSVEIRVKDRKATVFAVPSTSALIIKALKEPIRDRKKEKNIVHNGSIELTDVIEIARKKMAISKARTLKNMVKSVLGTCVSVGCHVDGRNPKDVTKDITDGVIEIPEN